MTLTTTEQAPLTEAEIRSLAAEWFSGLNEHRPMVEMLPLLSTDGLRMVFPESTLTTMVEFEGWYQGVIRLFFDQDHLIRDVTVRLRGDEADVDVTVIWKASQWVAPAATSTRSVMRADQTWTVKRSHTTGKPVIAEYTVRSLSPVSE
jgi:hypothetical protein